MPERIPLETEPESETDHAAESEGFLHNLLSERDAVAENLRLAREMMDSYLDALIRHERRGQPTESVKEGMREVQDKIAFLEQRKKELDEAIEGRQRL